MGEIVPIFSQKFFQNFFYEYFIHAIEPPFYLSKCHIWGGYGGGGGTYAKTPIWEGVCQDPLVIYKVINNGGRISLVIRSYEHDTMSVLKVRTCTIFGQVESIDGYSSRTM